MAENINNLENAINNLESTFASTRFDRNLLIAKLKQSIDAIVLNPNEDSPRMTEVKLATLKALDDILKSAENNATTIAKTQLQKKSDENSESTKQMVIEMLKQINMSGRASNAKGVVQPSNMTQLVDKACQETNHPISDDELIMPDSPLSE